MRRREFVSILGGMAVGWPLTAQAQATLPVIGFLASTSAERYAIRLDAFWRGLSEAGYAEGQNVAIEYRWADDDNSRLPSLAAELVQRHVAVIAAAGGLPSALAAKAATSTIPIVFATAADPVAAGLVASLKRPGGNVTGVTSQNSDIGPKRLELLRQLLPAATTVGVLVNPTNPGMAEQFERGMEPTARALGLQLHVFRASNAEELDSVFAALAQLRVEALVVDPDQFFRGQAEQIAARALRQRLPTVYQLRSFAVAGGLVSYGSNETEYYRLVGSLVGKVLKGEKPAELPVQQSTQIELIINVKTAKALGLTVPGSILARADELIE